MYIYIYILLYRIYIYFIYRIFSQSLIKNVTFKLHFYHMIFGNVIIIFLKGEIVKWGGAMKCSRRLPFRDYKLRRSRLE